MVSTRNEEREGARLTAVIAANWKVPIDNFNESYHVVGLHPQQLPFIDDTNVKQTARPLRVFRARSEQWQQFNNPNSRCTAKPP
jgi:phenylpropionate dioxygenase-like ring-hydroxylating dioxygenase large terminal subunit